MKKLSKAKRRRRLKVLKMCGTAVVICIIMTVVFMLVKSAITKKIGTKSSRINYEQYVVPKPNVKKALLTVNKNSRPGIKLRNKRYSYTLYGKSGNRCDGKQKLF